MVQRRCCLTVTGSHRGAVAALFSQDWNSLGPFSRPVWREITVIESSHFALSPLWPRMDWYLFHSLPICGSVSTSHCFATGHFFHLQRLNRTWDVKFVMQDIKICHFSSSTTCPSLPWTIALLIYAYGAVNSVSWTFELMLMYSSSSLHPQ